MPEDVAHVIDEKTEKIVRPDGSVAAESVAYNLLIGMGGKAWVLHPKPGEKFVLTAPSGPMRQGWWVQVIAGTVFTNPNTKDSLRSDTLIPQGEAITITCLIDVFLHIHRQTQ